MQYLYLITVNARTYNDTKAYYSSTNKEGKLPKNDMKTLILIILSVLVYTKTFINPLRPSLAFYYYERYPLALEMT